MLTAASRMCSIALSACVLMTSPCFPDWKAACSADRDGGPVVSMLKRRR